MNLDAALATFVNESNELLQEMEQAALRLEESPDDPQAINAMFRAAHTIKGSSGVFGLDQVVAFTHVVENILDRVRTKEVAISSELIAVLLKCSDHMGTLVEQSARGGAVDSEVLAVGRLLLEQLTAAAGVPTTHAEATKPAGPGAQGQPDASGPQLPVANQNWHISLRFGRDSLRNGMDPRSFISYLAQLGEIVHIETLLDGLPRLQEMDPEACYLGFEIALRSSAGKQAIEDVFEFVRQDCKIQILPPRADLSHYLALIRSLPERPMRLGEILVACGALTQRELDQALAQQQGEGQRRPVGDILVEQQKVHAEAVGAALYKQQQDREQTSKRTADAGKSVRVDAGKLDRLINLVGELVIAGATTSQLASGKGDSRLSSSAEIMTRLVDEIRESTLRLRMVQIGETFNRFRRVVRDVSRQLGKEIELEISGGDTELDKAVVEKLADPLMHMVRNSMDHGIEPRDVRVARGKPPQGRLRLHAYHDSGCVVIEISDDGGGLHTDKILARARERGLVAPDQQLDKREIFQLIFAPGFSTAEKVTDLSGRGVGMDVVRSNIEALRGSVELLSEPGQGTTVRVRLPLTLAIIDGFLVRVEDSPYVIPLDVVNECVELPAEGRGAEDERRYINLRGEVLPFVVLRELFETQQDDPPAAATKAAGNHRENVVVVEMAGQKAGLVVDDLLGKTQSVIKPLGELFRGLRGISGSTVLGSGEVALILDVGMLIDQATRQEKQWVTASGERRTAAR